jgi:PiT family inorganic phosphate transporter
MTVGITLLALAVGYGVVSGLNDGGNLLASFTSGRVIRPRLAFALLFLVGLGPVMVGAHVAATIQRGIVDLPASGSVAWAAITASSLAAVALSWKLRTPTSMTLSLVAAMLGWAIMAGYPVHWNAVVRVILAVPISVVVGIAAAYTLYRVGVIFLGSQPHGRMLAVARFQVVGAGAQAIAYGANDMEKTMGLMLIGEAAIGWSTGDLAISLLAVFAAAVSFLLGSLLGGWRLAERVGFGMLRVRPVQAMAEQLAAAAVVGSMALAGLPVSSTQTINGSMLGVGLSTRASSLRWRVVRDVLFSWVITVPLTFVLALGLWVALRAAGIHP